MTAAAVPHEMSSSRVPLLRIQDVRAYAEGTERPLLDRIELAVPAGSVTAVVGPSGSGKTTLGLAALGASRGGVRLTGRVLLAGTDLLLQAPERRPRARAGRAAYLPQHPETVLDPLRRAGGLLTELAALGHPDRAARKPAVRRALADAGLDPDAVRRRFPHQLSGGQQQRLALASVLVTGARLLVLDEPTSGLDPALAHALGRTLRALADTGAGVLLLSHDLPLVRDTADRVSVLEHGRAVDGGPVAVVLGEGGAVPYAGGRVPYAGGSAAGTPAAGARQAAVESPVGRHPATRELLAAEHRTQARQPETPTRSASPTTSAPPATAADDDTTGLPGILGTVAAAGVVVRRRAGDPLPGPVSLAFPPGSRTALFGPSGSGKTTFARVLAGLTTPTRGDVRVDGSPLPRRIDRRTAEQRRVVQYVHQTSADSFEERRPLLDQLADTARLLRGLRAAEAASEVASTAHALGLDEALLRRTPGRLSGGQLQRCALVRALAARPSLLVCDEVTSALDTASRERLVGALPRLLAPERTALLLISHEPAVVRALARTAVRFEGGRRVRCGPVDELLLAETWCYAPGSSG